MKISIIIPVHNEEKYIVRCIDSFLRQNDSDLELIIINDHSEDHSGQLCLEMQRKNECIKYYESDQTGVSAARNLGIQYATGDIIGFCDADDTTQPHSLQIIRDVFEENIQADMVVSGYNRVEAGEDEIQKTSFTYNEVSLWNSVKLINHILYDRMIMGSVCNKFFRRNVIGAQRFNVSLEYCEDMHFLVKVLSTNKDLKILILNKALYNYFVNTNSATNTVDRMFDNMGRLKYQISMEMIVTECNLKRYTYCLARRNQFIIASDTMIGFGLSELQISELKKILRHNFLYFIIMLYIKPRESLYRLKVLLKREY